MSTPETSAPVVKTNHPIGFWFFFWGEFAERCSYYGMRAILLKYMIDKRGIEEADANTYYFLFMAACYFLPILGGYIADNFLGKYWTIVGFSLPYVLGQYTVGIDNNYVFLGSLALLAMGSGVIKPNISTLMGLTYDQQRPGQDALRTSAFQWFYCAINIGAGISQVVMPILRTKYSYQTAFLFPCALMALALLLFALGKPYYAVEKIERRTLSAEEKSERWRVLKQISGLFFFVIFFWAIFDQSGGPWVLFADVYMDRHVFGYELEPDGVQAANAWFIVLLTPVFVWLWGYLGRKNIKIKATSKMQVGFLLTAASMGILALAGFMAGKKQEITEIVLPIGSVIVPKVNQAEIQGKSANLKTEAGELRITNGTWGPKSMAMIDGEFVTPRGSIVYKNGNVDTAASAAFLNATGKEWTGPLNIRWKDDYNAALAKVDLEKTGDGLVIKDSFYVPRSEQVTVWWKIFAFFVITVAEILISVTGLELAFVFAPPTMKGLVTGFWLVCVGIANLFINAPVSRLYTTMDPGAYFGMLAVLMLIVTLGFTLVARPFNKMMAEKERAKAFKE